ncbi:DUF5701 family protein [Haloactinomyces albus]|uniref:DUF5701 family protein n=1 Tax=Haloactinomyces albus TaxID=1352928 RepID=UPI0035B547D5
MIGHHRQGIPAATYSVARRGTIRGSRAGDKRVTGIRVSKGAPRLGWCWGGNPHTWLSMASAARRIG